MRIPIHFQHLNELSSSMDYCTIRFVITILALKKAGHLNIKTKMAGEYSQRVFASQPIRTRASKLF